MTHEEERLQLIDKLRGMNPMYRKVPVPADEQGQKDLADDGGAQRRDGFPEHNTHSPLLNMFEKTRAALRPRFSKASGRTRPCTIPP